MIQMVPMFPAHSKWLYEIMRDHDPLFCSPSIEHLMACLEKVEGWSVVVENKIVGMVGFTDFKPGLTVTIHGVVHPEWRRKWITRKNLSMVFGKPFIELDLPRVDGYMVVGLNDQDLSPFFAKLGFTQEGYKRNGFLLKGRLYDLIEVGMLREDCRWL